MLYHVERGNEIKLPTMSREVFSSIGLDHIGTDLAPQSASRPRSGRHLWCCGTQVRGACRANCPARNRDRGTRHSYLSEATREDALRHLSPIADIQEPRYSATQRVCQGTLRKRDRDTQPGALSSSCLHAHGHNSWTAAFLEKIAPSPKAEAAGTISNTAMKTVINPVISHVLSTRDFPSGRPGQHQNERASSERDEPPVIQRR